VEVLKAFWKVKGESLMRFLNLNMVVILFGY